MNHNHHFSEQTSGKNGVCKFGGEIVEEYSLNWKRDTNPKYCFVLHNYGRPPLTPATKLGQAGKNERKNAPVFGFRATYLERSRRARKVFGLGVRKGFWFCCEEGFFVKHNGRLFCSGSIKIEFPLQSHMDFIF